jgi:hypothetical protein
MKKYFFIVFAIAFTAQINAQNNLVFNQVILLELTSSGTTVPEGKVWKVEDGQLGNFYSVNGLTWLIGASGSYKNTPTWFPEGSVFKKYAGSSSLNTLSILEFDVVPVSTTSTGSGGLSSEGLEFNQVINYSNTVTTGPLGDIVDNLEVPEGKVWKITRVFLNGYAYVYPTRPYDVSNCSVELGGQNLFYRPSTSGYSNSSFENYPVWINSGTKSLIIGHGEDNNKSFKISISAIEYNIPQ